MKLEPEPCQSDGSRSSQIPGSGRLRLRNPEKFSAYNLAGEFFKILRTLIANRKYKLAAADKSAKWS